MIKYKKGPAEKIFFWSRAIFISLKEFSKSDFILSIPFSIKSGLERVKQSKASLNMASRPFEGG